MPFDDILDSHAAATIPTQQVLSAELNEFNKYNNYPIFISLNIRSLLQNCDELTNLLSTFDFEFSGIIITETYLKSYNKDFYTIKGFDAFHAFPSEKRGGGVY